MSWGEPVTPSDPRTLSTLTQHSLSPMSPSLRGERTRGLRRSATHRSATSDRCGAWVERRPATLGTRCTSVATRSWRCGVAERADEVLIERDWIRDTREVVAVIEGAAPILTTKAGAAPIEP